MVSMKGCLSLISKLDLDIVNTLVNIQLDKVIFFLEL